MIQFFKALGLASLVCLALMFLSLYRPAQMMIDWG